MATILGSDSETSPLRNTHAEINMTPLIDVLLVILIIFMIITPILTTAMMSEIPKKLDETVAETYSERQIVLSLTVDGAYFLNREHLTLAELPNRLRETLAERGGSRLVFVNADDGVRYGLVVQLMDLCHTAGAEHVSLVLDPLQPSDTSQVH